jgi:hypothetical protein
VIHGFFNVVLFNLKGTAFAEVKKVDVMGAYGFRLFLESACKGFGERERVAFRDGVAVGGEVNAFPIDIGRVLRNPTVIFHSLDFTRGFRR